MRLGAPALRARKVIILLGWSAMGVGGAIDGGHFSNRAIILVVVGTALLLLITWGAMPLIGRFTREAAFAALGTAVAAATILPAGVYGVGAPLLVSRALTLAVALGVFTFWWVRPQYFTRVAYVSIALMAGAGVAMLISSPKPPIDVWYLLQAAGHALDHGQNIYTTKWSTGVPGEVTNGFAYLPASAILLWPFHAVLGDVRYGLLAAMVGTGLLMVRFGHRRLGLVAAALLLLYPRALLGIEQSWVDPLVLVTVAVVVVAMAKNQRGWAVVALAVCLACKQQAWILLPVAALWKDFGWRRAATAAAAAAAFILPWVLAAPQAFYNGAIRYDFSLPARDTSNSLSLYSFLVQHGVNPGFGFTIGATAGAIALCRWRLPNDAFGFCLGAAIAEAVFNLSSKQPYFNEWQLAAGLALLAVAFGTVRRTSAPDPVLAHERGPVALAAGAATPPARTSSPVASSSSVTSFPA